jgi:hypothetical protein
VRAVTYEELEQENVKLKSVVAQWEELFEKLWRPINGLEGYIDIIVPLCKAAHELKQTGTGKE